MSKQSSDILQEFSDWLYANRHNEEEDFEYFVVMGGIKLIRRFKEVENEL